MPNACWFFCSVLSALRLTRCPILKTERAKWYEKSTRCFGYDVPSGLVFSGMRGVTFSTAVSLQTLSCCAICLRLGTGCTQVLSVRCGNCLLSNLVASSSKLVRCGVCGCISELEGPLSAAVREHAQDATDGCSAPSSSEREGGASKADALSGDASQEVKSNTRHKSGSESHPQSASSGDDSSGQKEARSNKTQSSPQSPASDSPQAAASEKSRCLDTSSAEPGASAAPTGKSVSHCGDEKRPRSAAELRLEMEKMVLQPYWVESARDYLPPKE